VSSVSVIIRCDGGAAIGMGHVSRCLALAGEWRDAHRGAVTFAMRDPSGAAAAVVASEGYDVEPLAADESSDYGDWLLELATARAAAAVIVDVRDRLSRASLDRIRKSGVLVVSIDEGTERRLASDLAFYPPVPQVGEMDWTGFTGRRYAGWEWVILKREFASDAGAQAFPTSARSESSSELRGLAEAPEARRRQASDDGSAESLALQPSAAIDILLTMGGSDPAGMTEFAVEALECLAMPLAIRVVVGPAFSRAEELIDVIARSKHAVRIARAPRSMATLMRASRIAVVSFGVSAYELAACGVPAVHLCLSDDHARSSSAFEKAGIAITAGAFGRVQPEQLADAVSRLMSNAGRRTAMAERARQLVDGRGAQRAAELIASRLPSAARGL
jgi:spore coat polysaccharide biosynthesis protein SpsF